MEKENDLNKNQEQNDKEKNKTAKKDTTKNKTNSKNVTLIDARFPHIKEVLIDSYDEILTSRDSIVNLYRKAIGGWSRSLDREVEWAKITGFFSDASKLDRQHKNSIKEYNRVIDAVNELDELQYWTTDSRREDLDFIENAIEYMELILVLKIL